MARVCALAGAALALWSAEPRAAADWSASLGLASDYVHRGLSQTAGEFSAQAGASLRETRSGLYAGALASRIEPAGPPGAPEVELYFVVGASGGLPRGWVWDLSAARYGYPGDERALDYDYTELAAALGYTDRARLACAWLPEVSGSPYTPPPSPLPVDPCTLPGSPFCGTASVRSGSVHACEVAASWPLPLAPSLALTGGIGYQDLDETYGIRHRYWSAGGAWRYGALVLDLSVYGTDRRARRVFGEDSAGGRLVLSAVLEFAGRIGRN